MKTVVYIPSFGSTLWSALDPGSAVVAIGNPRNDGVRAVCWESRGFAERVASTFADRAERAHERARDHRNDLRRLVNGDDLRMIGRFDTATGTVELDFEQDAAFLAHWLGRTSLDPVELTTTRGIVVQMVRESVREHGDRLPAGERKPAAASSRGKLWHTA
jgi:hypothetical protein